MTTPQERLENYSRSHPREVLRLTVQDGEILIYKGFTSSLSRATAFDPDVPVLEPDTEILWVDRIQAPYHPQQVHYLEQNVNWAEFSQRLEEAGF